MERIVFEVQPRAEIGKSANKRYRSAGLLPSVVYSHGEASIPLLIGYKDFCHRSKLARSSQIFTLKSKDAAVDGRPVVVKEIQRNYLDGAVLHVDFQALKEDEAITVRIPLNIVGEPVGVKLQGGILTIVCHDLAVRCLPRNIPDTITVDVTSLEIGHNIHADGVKLPEGVDLADSPEETIVSVVVPKVVEEAKPATAEAAPAEGEAAAAAAGTAAPAGAAPAEGGGKKAESAKK